MPSTDLSAAALICTCSVRFPVNMSANPLCLIVLVLGVLKLETGGVQFTCRSIVAKAKL